MGSYFFFINSIVNPVVQIKDSKRPIGSPIKDSNKEDINNM